MIQALPCHGELSTPACKSKPGIVFQANLWGRQNRKKHGRHYRSAFNGGKRICNVGRKIIIIITITIIIERESVGDDLSSWRSVTTGRLGSIMSKKDTPEEERVKSQLWGGGGRCEYPGSKWAACDSSKATEDGSSSRGSALCSCGQLQSSKLKN